MNVKNSTVGVWGFGVVGKSAVNYLQNNEAHIEVLVDTDVSENDRAILAQKEIPLLGHDNLHGFLERNQYILPSPGIDLTPYPHVAHKWLAELDLFRADYKKPIIAVTGTVGKTSVTHILDQLLNAYGVSTITGGNIGTGMLDLLDHQENSMALLEVSSFQLELCKTFAPDLAIWTTFSENHLDRHGTMTAYFAAKYAIVKNQTAVQQALLPFELLPFLHTQEPAHSSLALFLNRPPTSQELDTANQYGPLFFVRDEKLIRSYAGHEKIIFDMSTLPAITFNHNWLIIVSALFLLKLPLTQLEQLSQTVSIPEHRLEKVATIGDVSFYNDSKSTTPPSTQAAIAIFGDKPIHLFLGGLSKGIDRAPLIKTLPDTIQHVYCFGKEAEALQALCATVHKASSAHPTLEDAFDACLAQARPGSIVLLSPAGSSYDLFVDYRHRGKRFKELVHAYRTRFAMIKTTLVEIPHKDSIIKIITAFYPDAKIYLFGSYATGRQRPGSDIDIAVDVGKRMNLKEWSFLWNLLDALPTAQTVDLVDMHAIPEAMLQAILDKGIPWKN